MNLQCWDGVLVHNGLIHTVVNGLQTHFGMNQDALRQTRKELTPQLKDLTEYNLGTASMSKVGCTLKAGMIRLFGK